MNIPEPFELETAVRTWREAMAARDSFDPEALRELESHLRDSASRLAESGLSGAEAFLVAARRLGGPDALAEEFNRGEPLRAWRRRTFWMTAGLVFAGMLSSLFNLVMQFSYAVFPGLGSSVIPFLNVSPTMFFWVGHSALLLGGLWAVSQGRLERLARWMAQRYDSRHRLMVDACWVGVAEVAMQYAGALANNYAITRQAVGPVPVLSWFLLLHYLQALVPLALLVSMAPRKVGGEASGVARA
ncbi:MAG TPA: hypothetical protein DCM86_18470 [Verrucomicrobiales bacterium]|nr:hypothetical protein [Verrucomicrobiales bacterium]